MYRVISFLLIFTVISCKSSKTDQAVDLKNMEIIEGCPDNSDCEIEVLNHQKIDLQTEKVTGRSFTEFKKDSTVNSIKITVDQNVDKTAVDGQYHEEILFEWPRNEKNLNKKDKELEDLEFVFGRFCFCAKEQIGYFKIKDGEIITAGNEIHIDFMNSDEVPQILQKLKLRYEMAE